MQLALPSEISAIRSVEIARPFCHWAYPRRDEPERPTWLQEVERGAEVTPRRGEGGGGAAPLLLWSFATGISGSGARTTTSVGH